MGLSSLPTPSEGVLTLLLVNTALTISILKEIFRSVLHVFGLSPEASSLVADVSAELPYLWSSPVASSEQSLTEKFRNTIKPLRFGSAAIRRRAAEWHADCRVCLARFEPDSMVNRLPCGHLFHKICVERWLDYGNDTCPLCRSRIFPGDELSGCGAGVIAALPVW